MKFWIWLTGICKCGHWKKHHQEAVIQNQLCLMNVLVWPDPYPGWEASGFQTEKEWNMGYHMDFCGCKKYKRNWWGIREAR